MLGGHRRTKILITQLLTQQRNCFRSKLVSFEIQQRKVLIMKAPNRLMSRTLVTALLLLAGITATAQRGTSVVSRISFARGRTTAVLSGTVRRGMSHDYLLKARGGQTMTVHLAARGGVGFEILAPNGDLISEFTKDWSGDLPSSGDYRINVLPDTTTERSISYTLEVTVR